MYFQLENSLNLIVMKMVYSIAFSIQFLLVSSSFLTTTAMAQTSQCDAARSLLAEGKASGAGKDELAVYSEILASAECTAKPKPQNSRSSGSSPVAGPAQSTSPVAAREVPIGPFTETQCKSAVDRLAINDGKDAQAGQVFEHVSCARLRDAKFVVVNFEMSKMMKLMRDEGIDYTSKLSDKIAECELQADETMGLPVDAGKFRSDRAELVSICSANAQMLLYSDGIIEMNTKRQNKFATETAAYERAVRENAEKHRKAQAEHAAKIAANEAEYQEWRRGVVLCKGSKTEYCKKTQ